MQVEVYMAKQGIIRTTKQLEMRFDIASLENVSKVCSGCWNEKKRADFSRNSSHKDGLQSYCRDCGSSKHKRSAGLAQR